jgi:hypothetical protein
LTLNGKAAHQDLDFALTETHRTTVPASISYDDRLASLQSSLFTAPFDSYELFLLLIITAFFTMGQGVEHR